MTVREFEFYVHASESECLAAEAWLSANEGPDLSISVFSISSSLARCGDHGQPRLGLYETTRRGLPRPSHTVRRGFEPVMALRVGELVRQAIRKGAWW